MKSDLFYTAHTVGDFLETIDHLEPDISQMRKEVLELSRKDPYYIEPLLFLARHAARESETENSDFFTTQALESLTKFLLNHDVDWSVVAREIRNDPAMLEKIESLGHVFSDLREYNHGNSHWRTAKRWVLRCAYKMRLRQIGARRVPRIKRTLQNVIFKDRVDITALKTEVRRYPEVWSRDVERQQRIPPHRHTQAIPLYALSSSAKESIAKREQPDNLRHDATQTTFAHLFPHTTDFLETFCREHNLILGKAAVVRLAPHSMVYGHYDFEAWLKEQDRYHLVIESDHSSQLRSGRDVVDLAEGDCAWLQNKKYHEAINLSSTWRVHLIFDTRSRDAVSYR